MHNLKHNKVLHEHNLFVTVRHHDIPWIGFERRITMEPLGHDCWQVTLNFGFKNEARRARGAQKCCRPGRAARPDGHQLFPVARHRDAHAGEGMSLWREKLFANMHRNAAAADFLSHRRTGWSSWARRSRSEPERRGQRQQQPAKASRPHSSPAACASGAMRMSQPGGCTFQHRPGLLAQHLQHQTQTEVRRPARARRAAARVGPTAPPPPPPRRHAARRESPP